MKKNKILKNIALTTTLMMGLTIIPNNIMPNLLNKTITASAAEITDTSWTVVNYLEGLTIGGDIDLNPTSSQVPVPDIPEEATYVLNEKDEALIHENNWLNNMVASVTGNTLETLTLTDFLRIKTLSCPDSNITVIPESIKFMVNMTTLDFKSMPASVNKNSFTELPSCVGNLVNLTSISCYNTGLMSLPSSITNLTKLVNLECYGSYLTKVPDNIAAMPGLSITLGYNFISGKSLQRQLSISNTSPLTLDVGNSVNVDSIIFKAFKLGMNNTPMPQSVVSKLQVVADDPTIIDSTGKALKSGITNIRIQLPENPNGNVAGITQSSIQVTVTAPSLSTSDDILIKFNQADTIELTLSTNTVDFGDVTGIQTTSTNTTPTELVASVKSSLPYDLDIVATDNFSNKTNIEAAQVPITKLGINVDGGATSKFEGVNVSKNLVTNASDTSALTDVTRSHTIKFDLDETIGYKAGNYEVPLTITATQK